ncbi:MAG: peptidoglycan DD-metalloendopeptidase family protein [Anaerolineaceae bacterium]|nr:peptidoglycan DD-metalloendopeptidase family protein [Anaerolineaceae bacterium]
MKKSRVFFLLILLSLLLFGLPNTNSSAAVEEIIITDFEFLSTEGSFLPENIQTILDAQSSPLASYQEHVGDKDLPASQSFWLASQQMDFGLNPKVLLTTYALQYGLTEIQDFPLTLTLQNLTFSFWENFNAYKQGSHEISLSGGESVSFSNANAATFAIAKQLSLNITTEEELVNSLQAWRTKYQDLFASDPKNAPIMAKDAPAVLPFLQLPFDQPADDFIKVNSFVDLASPGVYDDSIMRFDGKSLSPASFSTCILGVTCYGGHNGVDYRTLAGPEIKAAAAGTVVYRYFNTDPAQGNVDSGVIIDHGNGYRTAYWHMDPIQVEYRQEVAQGDVIGISGNVGMSSGPHLHFGLRITEGYKSVDPYGWWSNSVSDPWGDSQWQWQGDLIADNRESQAQLFYRSYWNHENRGYDGSSSWTASVNQSSESTNWGMWGTFIETPGVYDVFAYWPGDSGSTRSAKYQIFHQGGDTTVSMDQSIGGDDWVLLGSFNFDYGDAAVFLTDLTDDIDRRIYFDAIRWAPQGQFPTATPNAIGAGKYDDTHSAITYSGTWIEDNTSGPYNDTLHFSGQGGNVALMTFFGGQVQLTYSSDPTRGIIEIYLDDNLIETLNQQGESLNWQQTWTSSEFDQGMHTLRIVHASGSFVDIDAIEIFNAAEPAETPTEISGPDPTQTQTPTPTTTNTSQSNPGSSIEYDDSDSKFIYFADPYRGLWKTTTNENATNGNYHRSDDTDSYATFAFEGNRFTLIYNGYLTRGIAELYIDGELLAAVNQYVPTTVGEMAWQQHWDSPDLGEGQHILKILHKSGQNIDIDGLIIYQGEISETATTQPSQTATASHTATLIPENTSTLTATPTATPSPTTAPENSKTPTATQTQTKTPENIPGSSIEYDDNHSKFSYFADPYQGLWKITLNENATNGNYHRSDDIGSYAKITFEGSSFSLIYGGYLTRGTAELYIDGKLLATLNQYVPTDLGTMAWQQRWDSPDLGEDSHTLKIIHKTGRNIDIDSLIVHQGTPEETKTPTVTATVTQTKTTTQTNLPSDTPDVPASQTATATVTPTNTSTKTMTATKTAAGTLENTKTPTLTTIPPTKTKTPAAFAAVEYDDSDSGFKYYADPNRGLWKVTLNENATNGVYHRSDDTDSYATFSFTGSRFTLIYGGYLTRGTAELYLDGKLLAVVNQYVPTDLGTMAWQQHWDSPDIGEGQHSILILHKSGRNIDIDGIIVYQGSPVETEIPTQTKTATFTKTTTPTSSQTITQTATFTKTVTVTNTTTATPTATQTMTQTGTLEDTATPTETEIATTTSTATQTPESSAETYTEYDDNDSQFKYFADPTRGLWKLTINENATNGNYHRSDDTDSYATFSFEGNRFTLIYNGYLTRGTAELYLDGILLATVNQYMPTEEGQMAWQQHWESPEFSQGQHTLKIIHKTGRNIDIDGLIIYSDTSQTEDPTPEPDPDLVDLQINKLELIQTTLNQDNAAILIANRPALLRIFVDLVNQGSISNVVAQATCYINNQPVYGIRSNPDSVVQGNTGEDLFDTINIEIPLECLQDEAVVHVDIDPDNLIQESNEDNNRYPANGISTFQLNNIAPVDIVIVPIQYQRQGVNTLPNINDISYLTWMPIKVWPVSTINYEVHTPISFTGDLRGTDGAGWIQLLSMLDVIHSSEDPEHRKIYYGVVDAFSADGCPSGGCIVGLGYIGRPTAVGFSGWGPGTIEGGETMTHEIGHTFGLWHAPCGNPSGVDPNWPSEYNDGSIGTIGFDHATGRIFYPESYKDYMSYCDPTWTSDYTYNKIIQLRENQSYEVAFSPSSPDAAPTKAMYLSGSISGNHVELQPISIVNAPIKLESIGQYRLIFTDLGGNILYAHNFDLIPIPDANGQQGFGFFAPFINNIGTIKLYNGSQLIYLASISGENPEITEIKPPAFFVLGDFNTVYWNLLSGSRAETIFQVRFSPDGGETWQMIEPFTNHYSATIPLELFSGASQPIVEVQALDGIRNDILIIPMY